MELETTIVILKPDCVQKKHCGEVISRFEQLGLELIAVRFGTLDEQLVREHYSHLHEQSFFERLITFMTSGPSMVIGFRGSDAISAVRKALGPTDCAKAPVGTIRGDFGEKLDPTRTSMFNIAHGSDSNQSAEIELRRFFPDIQM